MDAHENLKSPCNWIQGDTVNNALAVEKCGTVESIFGSAVTSKYKSCRSGHINVHTNPIKGQAINVSICNLKTQVE